MQSQAYIAYELMSLGHVVSNSAVFHSQTPWQNYYFIFQALNALMLFVSL